MVFVNLFFRRIRHASFVVLSGRPMASRRSSSGRGRFKFHWPKSAHPTTAFPSSRRCAPAFLRSFERFSSVGGDNGGRRGYRDNRLFLRNEVPSNHRRHRRARCPTAAALFVSWPQGRKSAHAAPRRWRSSSPIAKSFPRPRHLGGRGGFGTWRNLERLCVAARATISKSSIGISAVCGS